MGDRSAIALIRSGLRIVLRGGNNIVCCNTRHDWLPGGLMGRPFFTVFCDHCLTLYVNRPALRDLRDFLKLERCRGR